MSASSTHSSSSHGIDPLKQPEEKPPVEVPVKHEVGFAEDTIDVLRRFGADSIGEDDMETILEHIDDRDVDECVQILQDALIEHEFDENFDDTDRRRFQLLVDSHPDDASRGEWELAVKFDAFLVKDWSIYPFVRSVTKPIEEPFEGEYETFRVYLLSILWGCAGSCLASFFEVRFPSISLNSTAVQILVAYSARLLSYLPAFGIPLGKGRKFWINDPHRFNYQEQVLASIGVVTGDQYAYAQDAILAMSNKYFYNYDQAKGAFGFAILLILSSNLMGFGLAGVFRTFLVYPSEYIWFNVLPNLALSRTLTEEVNVKRENANGWKLRGWEWFWIVAWLEFGWYWICDFLFGFLTYFDWMTAIAPNNLDNVSITSTWNSGLAFLNPVPTFDPALTGGLPGIVMPFFSNVNTFAGAVIGGLAIIVMWYTNVQWTGYLPINTNTLYNSTGQSYEVSEILDSNLQFSEEGFRNYGYPFWSAGNLAVYGAFFMVYPALVVYSILNHGYAILRSFKIFAKTVLNPRAALLSFDDRFSRAQRKHKEVPEYYFLAALVITLALAIACVEHYSFTNTPVWTIFFALGISAFFMVPAGAVFAKTYTQITINVLYEIIIGLACEHNGNALQIAKVYGTNFMIQSDSYIGSQKTGHYAGLAPWSMFRVQFISLICNSFVQAGLTTWQSNGMGLGNPDSPEPSKYDMCSPLNPEKFTCQDIRTYFNASVMLGFIGPRLFFQHLYKSMKWTFLIGACIPIPIWLARLYLVPYGRRWAENPANKARNAVVRAFMNFRWLTSINELVMMYGALNYAPTNMAYGPTPYLWQGGISQYIRKRFPLWWSKYNYLAYAAVTVGYSFSALFMFFATEYHHIASVNWWGNPGSTEDDFGSRQLAKWAVEHPDNQPLGGRLPIPPEGFGPTNFRTVKL